MKRLGLYGWNIDGYYSDDLINTVYDFQLQQWIVNTPYDAWAWFWWKSTRAAFFENYGDTNIDIFRPNDSISKAEAIKILFKFSDIQWIDPKQLWYIDITESWHEKYIRTWESLGLFDAESDGYSFNPDSGVKREDMIDLINRLVYLYR